MTLHATGVWTGRRPECAPNPAYPDGIDVVAANLDAGDKTCRIELSYPAPSVGHWVIECDTCARITIVTAASRPDDPRSARVACQRKP